MSYRVSTQVYSGPFDLLLQLVTRQKVDIGAISISEVAEQYLAEAERIEALDLDVASDFLLVAATLLDIKAASLVPQEAPRKVDDDDDEFDEDLEELSALDGSSIIVPFLKGKALNNYYRLQQYAMPILILVLYLLPMWTGIDVIGRYFDVTVYPLAEQLLNFAIAGI